MRTRRSLQTSTHGRRIQSQLAGPSDRVRGKKNGEEREVRGGMRAKEKETHRYAILKAKKEKKRKKKSISHQEVGRWRHCDAIVEELSRVVVHVTAHFIRLKRKETKPTSIFNGPRNIT